MAKKTKTRQGERAAARRDDRSDRYDDSAYEDLRYSITYSMDELQFSRAASLVAPSWLYNVGMGIAFVGLVAIILLLISNPDNLVPALVCMAVSLIGTYITGNWSSVVMRMAAGSTLALTGTDNHRHVVITDTELTELGPDDRKATYPLSDLKKVHADDDACVLDFGSKRYVYAPKSAMSENRFRALVREARERTGQPQDDKAA